jgi:hypothetical protein
MTPKQIIIIAIGVAVLAGGITYLVASIGPSGDTGAKPPGVGEQIPSPIEIAAELGPRFEEAFTAGHHAFRFRSKVDKPTTVGVNWKNCKCASVEICIAPNEWKALPEVELVKKAEDPSLEWTPLDKEGKGFDIPGMAIGWVRIGWKADKSGDERFKADLWLYSPDHGIGFPLEIGVSFVEAVRIRCADDLEKIDPYIGRLGPGDQKDAKLVIWSSTRESFTLEPAPARPDPCFHYGDPKKLTDEQLKRLTQNSRKALSGYEVAITVHERAEDKQLDIGPFRREVRWKSDAVKDPIRAHVQGIILGEVTASVAGSEEPRLDMGVMNAGRPRVHKIHLETENSKVELALDDATCDFLQVKMLDGKEGKKEDLGDGTARKTWTVNVSFRSDSGFRGRFPDPDKPGYESCAVVFRIAHAGDPNEAPRRIKVMVRGQVRD